MKNIRWNYGKDPTGQGFFWQIVDINGINQKKQEYFQVKRNNPVVCQNIYNASPGNRQGVIFVEEDFSFYMPPAELAFGCRSADVVKFLDKGSLVVQAWDTAFSATSESDYTVCITGLLIPCNDYHRGEEINIYGLCDHHFDVLILDVFRDKIDYAGVVQEIRLQNVKWRPNMILVEKKAYGAAALEALENTNLPLIAVQPVDGKRARAVEGIGAGSVQGWFRRHRVAFPAEDAEWLEDLQIELKDFTGERGAKDDQVDALVHLVQFAIREGATAGLFPADWDTVEKVDRQMHASGDKLGGLFALQDQTLEAFINAGLIDNPFDGTCSACKYFWKDKDFCGYHRRKTAPIFSCDDFVDPEFADVFNRGR